MSEVGPIGLEEVRLVLRERLGYLREEDDQPYGRVFVGSLEEASGGRYAVFRFVGEAPVVENLLVGSKKRGEIRSARPGGLDLLRPKSGPAEFV